MLRAELYTELEKDNLQKRICEKDMIKQELQLIRDELNIPLDSLIIEVKNDNYILWFEGNLTNQDKSSIRLDLAMRFRVETDLLKLEKTLEDVDSVMENYKFIPVSDKYCLLKYVDLLDDFVIMDIYIGVKEKMHHLQ